MRSNWLYLAMRSVRLAEPVLIWPAFVATARSAMNGIFGFARPVRHHGSVAVLESGLHSVQRFRQGADLIHLHQNGVRNAQFDAFVETRGIGDE